MIPDIEKQRERTTNCYKNKALRKLIYYTTQNSRLL